MRATMSLQVESRNLQKNPALAVYRAIHREPMILETIGHAEPKVF